MTINLFSLAIILLFVLLSASIGIKFQQSQVIACCVLQFHFFLLCVAKKPWSEEVATLGVFRQEERGSSPTREKHPGAHDRGHTNADWGAYSVVGQKAPTRGRKNLPRISCQYRKTHSRGRYCIGGNISIGKNNMEISVLKLNLLILQELYKHMSSSFGWTKFHKSFSIRRF